MDYVLIAAFCTVVVLVFFTLPRLFLWLHRQAYEWERLEQTEEMVEAVLAPVGAQMYRQVDAALAEQRAEHQTELDATRRAIIGEFGELAAQMSRQVDATLAEQRAALQQEMDAIRDEVRNLQSGMSEMRRRLRAPDERVLRPGSEQRPVDPGALVVAPRRRRRAADAADVPALPTDSYSFRTTRVERRSLELRRSSPNNRPGSPAETAAQGTIRHDDPRHAAQAGPPAAPEPFAGSSHDQHVRVHPTPTLVSGMSRGGAARTRREARGTQSTAPALPQSFQLNTSARVGRFYEDVGSAVTRAPADSEPPVTPHNHRAASGRARDAEVPSSLDPGRGSEKVALWLRKSRVPAGALARSAFSHSAPVLLPIAAAAQAPRAREQSAQARGQSAPQRRYPPLSALLDGIEHERRAAPTQRRHSLSSGSLFYEEVVRRHVRREARAQV
jgi:hypothetical protein